MRNFWILLKQEIFMMMISPYTYVATVLFLLLTSTFYLVNISQYIRSSFPETPQERFYQIFWIPALFVCPLITMRALSEERRLGTLQTLCTTPTGFTSIVFSKFSAAYLFYLLLWSSTLSYPFITDLAIPSISEQIPITDLSSFLGGILFIALSGAAFIAVGIFSSSLTRSQLVAGIFCFTILFFLIVSGMLLESLSTPLEARPVWVQSSMDYLRTFQHLADFSKGIIDTRPLTYYSTLTFLSLGLSVLIVDWKSDT